MPEPVFSLESDSGGTSVLLVNWGTAQSTVEDVNQVTFTYECPGFRIADSSRLSIGLDSSWLCTGVGCSGSATLKSQGNKLEITLSRNDDIPVSGYGFLVRVSGIIVVVDDLVFRKPAPPQESLSYKVFPNPTTGYIRFEGDEDRQPIQMEIIDSRGIVREKFSDFRIPGKLNLSHLSKGMYVIRIHFKTSYEVLKIQLIP